VQAFFLIDQFSDLPMTGQAIRVHALLGPGMARRALARPLQGLMGSSQGAGRDLGPSFRRGRTQEQDACEDGFRFHRLVRNYRTKPRWVNHGLSERPGHGTNDSENPETVKT
jgi:hypothetical protein